MRRQRGAFTLIELLLVMAIIILVCAFALPAVISVMTAYNITTGADMVVGQLGNARQNALAHNLTVEVRFYSYALPEDAGASHYHSLQLFQYTSSGSAAPLTGVTQLPTGIIMDSGTLSSLLAASQKKNFTPTDPQVTLAGYGTNYTCSAFQIMPGGNTTLASAQWYITLHRSVDGDGLANPPHNYATIQIDPVSGVIRLYRP